jgi:citronellyl-CoA dehydrogenase
LIARGTPGLRATSSPFIASADVVATVRTTLTRPADVRSSCWASWCTGGELALAITGTMASSIAVAEPDARSDVAALRPGQVRDGEHWVINGAKTYITNGAQADWLCVLAPMSDEAGHRGMSQIVVPTDTPGFGARRTLHKLGNCCSDTAELSFTERRVGSTIGTVGRGFQRQMWQFEHERMLACYLAVGAMQAALGPDRRLPAESDRVGGAAAGQPKRSKYRLAELDAEIETLRQLNYGCVEAIMRGRSIARLWSIANRRPAGCSARWPTPCCSSTVPSVHGGQLWTARFLRDARLLSIGGGADEVMLRAISRLGGFISV